MHCERNHRVFLISIVVILVIVIFLASCEGTGDERRGTEVPIITTSLTVTPEPLPNLAIKEAWIEVGEAGGCIDPDLPQYQAHIEIMNNGRADAGSFHIRLNQDREENISKLVQGESIILEISAISERLEFLLDPHEEVLEEDETDNFHELTADFSSLPVCTPRPEATLSPQFSVFPLLPADVPISILQIHMVDESVGWGIGEAEKDIQHILRTDDGGSTWFDVTPPEIVPDSNMSFMRATAFFMDPEKAWVVFQSDPHGQPGIVWHTDDAGLTWQSSWKRVPGIIGSVSSWLVFDFIDSDTGWMLINHFVGDGKYEAELFLSQDGGKTWERLQNDQVLPWIRGSAGGMDFLDTSLGVLTSTNPMQAGVYVYWTEDGGKTWDEQKLTSPDTNQELFDLLYCGVSTPRHFAPQTSLLGVYCYNEDGISVPYLYQTTNRGITWRAYPFPGGFKGASIDVLNPEEILVLGRKADGSTQGGFGERGDLYRSVDGGKNWTSMGTVDWYGPIHFLDGQVGWGIARNQDGTALFHTDDGGLTWQELHPRTAAEESEQRTIVPPEGIALPQDLLPLTSSNIDDIQLLDHEIPNRVLSVAFTSDGKALILAQRDGWIIQWPIRESGYPLAAYRHSEPVVEMDVASEAVSIASASEGGTIKVWFMDSPIQFSLFEDTSEVSALALSPDGNRLASATKDGSVTIWDLSENLGRKIGSIGNEIDQYVEVVFSPNGQQVALASSEGIISFWDPVVGKQLGELIGHTVKVVQIAFAPDGLRLASVYEDGSLRIWDLTSRREELILEGDVPKFQSIAYLTEGDILAAGAADGNLYLWDTHLGELIKVLRRTGSPIFHVVFSPSGDVIATVSQDGLIQFWGVQPSNE